MVEKRRGPADERTARILPPPRALRELGRDVHHDELCLGPAGAFWLRHVHWRAQGRVRELDYGRGVRTRYRGPDYIYHNRSIIHPLLFDEGSCTGADLWPRLSFFLSLAMAEIAAAFPTAGGIYFWSYRLGGKRHGRLLSWMTAWWNWVGWICVVPGVQQGATNFLLSALEVKYPGSSVVRQGWFSWLVTALGLVLAMLPNIISPTVLKLYFRFALFVFCGLFAFYWIWFPIKAAGRFQSGSEVFNKFYNGINLGPEKQASDAYAWTVGILFGAWDFSGLVASFYN